MTPPLKAATEEMNRTRPKSRSRIPGNVRRASRKGARIDRQRMVEDRGIDVLETGLAREAVIGDEDVHRSERRLDIVDQLFWSIGICHVRAERTRRPKCSRNGPASAAHCSLRFSYSASARIISMITPRSAGVAGRTMMIGERTAQSSQSTRRPGLVRDTSRGRASGPYGGRDTVRRR
jgi:hypothetical protein